MELHLETGTPNLNPSHPGVPGSLPFWAMVYRLSTFHRSWFPPDRRHLHVMSSDARVDQFVRRRLQVSGQKNMIDVIQRKHPMKAGPVSTPGIVVGMMHVGKQNRQLPAAARRVEIADNHVGTRDRHGIQQMTNAPRLSGATDGRR